MDTVEPRIPAAHRVHGSAAALPDPEAWQRQNENFSLIGTIAVPDNLRSEEFDGD
jgi:hypothetical protein